MTCHGSGFVTYDLPAEDKDFGKAFTCPACWTDSAGRRQREIYSRLTDMQRLQTFAGWERRPELDQAKQMSLEQAYHAAKWFAEGVSTYKWLSLYGVPGCGKTRLAESLLNYRVDNPKAGDCGIFTTAIDLLDSLKQGFKDDSYVETMEFYRTVPLLVLDDLGAQADTDWVKEKLFQIFNYRYEQELETVVTFNDPQRIEPRIRSRLMDWHNGRAYVCHISLDSADDYRSMG